MHSFHQSRGRIAFEVLCALTVSASCVAAWMQTYATAFIPAAIATGLYGLWHLADMRSPKGIADLQAEPVVDAPVAPNPVIEAEPAQEPKPKKQGRKRKTAAPEVSLVPEATSAERSEPEPPVELPNRAAIEDEPHPPIAPLFEAKPLPFQQRPTFGRRGTLGI